VSVLVHKQFHLGHQYSYLSHLPPTQAELADEVVATLTPAGAKSVEFTTFLGSLGSWVAFEASPPMADPSIHLTERWASSSRWLRRQARYLCHLLTENRYGFIVDPAVTAATRTGERDA
jgi:hypothetical protein